MYGPVGASHRLSGRSPHVVEAAHLLDQPNDNRLFVDVRLGDPDEQLLRYRESHIHGAVHAQIRDVFAAPPTAQSGSLPLPSIESLRRQLCSWGVDAQTEIIVYGASPALASRGWWVLRWAGCQNVRVLDGGIRSWTSQGGPLAQGDSIPAKRSSSGTLELSAGHLGEVSVEQVETLPEQVLLIDARDESAFLAGAIPRAMHLPAADLWTPDGYLRTVDEIGSLLQSVGALDADQVVVYCGGGVLSALTTLALSAFGSAPRLFVGSWSQWSRSPDRMARSASTGVFS
ncbi:MAG: sulfurtransferase [Rhodoferax sp.]|nr:sulfurtransferase [Rhodoferax sp.]